MLKKEDSPKSRPFSTISIVSSSPSGAAARTRTIGYNLHPGKASHWLTYTDVETIYRECDIITIHLNLNDQSRHMINRETIAKMKDGVILINCARGGLMDTEAQIAAFFNMDILSHVCYRCSLVDCRISKLDVVT
ncbi:MAG: hypothetical protein LUI39_07690 [Lachnospiraceae bacterium]|nr:hypothetical protein [Lachnospiraceae bacterium]